MRKHFLAGILACTPLLANAQEAVTHVYDGSYDDATFAVETAIVGRGLNIDHISYVGDMLERTAGDVGSDKVIFDGAQIFQFCSAVLSRQVMEIDPMNLVFCPYMIFVADTGGQVVIGHRDFPDGEMQVIEDLLEEIILEALDG